MILVFLLCLVQTSVGWAQPTNLKDPTPSLGGQNPAHPAPAISMEELHQLGGVPRGWKFSLPTGDVTAGRKAYVDLGCHACHVVKDGALPSPVEGAAPKGPELTGMGSHHPPEYFAESILNPNAVIIAGPGYVGADGRSLMPTYPSMSLKQLADVVAYLISLKDDSGTVAHCAPEPAKPVPAGAFLAQVFEVGSDKLDGFYDWFEAQGIREYPGLLSVQTYAARQNEGHMVLVIFGFENEAFLGLFESRLAKLPAGSFVRPTEKYVWRQAPLYRVDGMSTSNP